MKNLATLKINKLTDRKNGYGMAIIEVISNKDIKVINTGYNEFKAVQEIDETDLLKLRRFYSPTETVMLEIKTPTRKTNCWYKLSDHYFGKNQSCIIW